MAFIVDSHQLFIAKTLPKTTKNGRSHQKGTPVMSGVPIHEQQNINVMLFTTLQEPIS
jgi:hypothetical protein